MLQDKDQYRIALDDVLIISQMVQQELAKRQYYRPIYSLHKWWARRPGTLFRSVLLLLESREPLFEVCQRKISLGSRYFKPFKNSEPHGKIVFDPFMGGGTTIVEALRLGYKTVGCDLNPVSYCIVRESVKDVDLQEIARLFDQLDRTAGSKISGLYRTKCPTCRAGVDSIYTFWLRAVACKFCGKRVDLWNRNYLSYGEKRGKRISDNNLAFLVCPYCNELNRARYGQEEVICKKCLNKFNPASAVYDRGYYTCPNCGREHIPLVRTIKEGHTLSLRPIAIEYFCDNCGRRYYKSIDEDDLENLRQVETEYDNERPKLIVPEERFPVGDSSQRLIQHGLSEIKDIFSKRQILSFNYLIREVEKIENEEYRNVFYTILSNSLEYNNMLSPYNYPHRKLHHLFNYHALPIPMMPVEVSFWGKPGRGSGNYANCYLRYLRAKQYAVNSSEKLKFPGRPTVMLDLHEKSICRLVTDFSNLKKTESACMLSLGDSAKFPTIPSGSIDYVVTDPPYYDYIHYSELSNIFLVWLSRMYSSLKNTQAGLVDSTREAIVNRRLGKSPSEYQTILTDVFKECNRVLKQEGRLAFTFHNSSSNAWWVLGNSLINSGFAVEEYLPVKSEYRVNPHIRGKRAGDSDLVLFCRRTGVHARADFSRHIRDRRFVFDNLQEYFGARNLMCGEFMRWYTGNSQVQGIALNLLDREISGLSMTGEESVTPEIRLLDGIMIDRDICNYS